jgi:CBS domain-containing protein
MSIESLISRDLLRTTADATLSDVATTMISTASGSVLVFGAQELVGDNPAGHRPGSLAGAEHRPSPGGEIHDYPSLGGVTDWCVKDIATRMINHGIEHVPVV